ncbi:trypsin-like peptidase domain-containing protein [Patescibacteria group bacterium]
MVFCDVHRRRKERLMRWFLSLCLLLGSIQSQALAENTPEADQISVYNTNLSEVPKVYEAIKGMVRLSLEWNRSISTGFITDLDPTLIITAMHNVLTGKRGVALSTLDTTSLKARPFTELTRYGFLQKQGLKAGLAVAAGNFSDDRVRYPIAEDWIVFTSPFVESSDQLRPLKMAQTNSLVAAGDTVILITPFKRNKQSHWGVIHGRVHELQEQGVGLVDGEYLPWEISLSGVSGSPMLNADFEVIGIFTGMESGQTDSGKWKKFLRFLTIDKVRQALGEA